MGRWEQQAVQRMILDNSPDILSIDSDELVLYSQLIADEPPTESTEELDEQREGEGGVFILPWFLEFRRNYCKLLSTEQILGKESPIPIY